MKLAEIQYKALEAISYDKFEDNKNLYIDFAFYLLDNGIESDNIFILAGLQNDPDYEIEYYFNTVIDELDISIEEDEKLHLIYAKSIARKIISKEIGVYEGIKKFEDLCYKSNFHPYYQEYLDLVDACDLLNENICLIEGLNQHNTEIYITRSFELFLEIHKTILPDDIYNSYYCESCLMEIQPLKKKRFSLFAHKRYMQLICPLCNSKKIYSFCTNEGKEIYLQQLNKENID